MPKHSLHYSTAAQGLNLCLKGNSTYQYMYSYENTGKAYTSPYKKYKYTHTASCLTAVAAFGLTTVTTGGFRADSVMWVHLWITYMNNCESKVVKPQVWPLISLEHR